MKAYNCQLQYYFEDTQKISIYVLNNATVMINSICGIRKILSLFNCLVLLEG